MNRVYLAARYSRREEMLTVREDLAAADYVVTSRWVNGAHQAESGTEHTPAEVELMARFAAEDLEDLRAADYFVSFQETPRRPSTNRGGRHVEFGYALAIGKPIICVGPLEHVFTALPSVYWFENWRGAFDYLCALRIDRKKAELRARYRPGPLR